MTYPKPFLTSADTTVGFFIKYEMRLYRSHVVLIFRPDCLADASDKNRNPMRGLPEGSCTQKMLEQEYFRLKNFRTKKTFCKLGIWAYFQWRPVTFVSYPIAVSGFWPESLILCQIIMWKLYFGISSCKKIAGKSSLSLFGISSTRESAFASGYLKRSDARSQL